MKQKTGRKLLGVLLALSMVVGLVPGMGLTAYAATTHTGTVASQNISAGDTISSGTTINGNTYYVEIDGITQRLPDNRAKFSAENGYWTAPSEYLVDEVDTVSFTNPTIKLKTPTIAVSSVTLDKTAISISINGVTELTATVTPTNATDKTVTWTTSDANVATVADGVVTPVGEGTATITATATNGTADTSDDKTATCTVTVSIPVTGLTIVPDHDTMLIGDELVLQFIFTPEDATSQEFDIDGYDLSIIDVDGAGIVHALAEGTTTITVTATNGTEDKSDDCTATCVVTVNKLDSSIVEAPAGKNLTYNGQAQELITAGIAKGGDMQYAIGTDNVTAPTSGYTASIPTGTEAGTYYIWYKVVGNDKYADTEAQCITAVIHGEISATVTFVVKMVPGMMEP